MPRKNKQDEIKLVMANIQDNNTARRFALRIEQMNANMIDAYCARQLGYTALDENEAARKAAYAKGMKFRKLVAKGIPVPANQQAIAFAILPFLSSISEAVKQQEHYSALIRKDLEKLPIYAWIKATKGLGGEMRGIGELLGIVGDMRRFRDKKGLPGLFKYLRLSVQDGRSYRIGSPGNRSCVWMNGFQLITHNAEYKALYQKRKAYELTKLDSIREMVREDMIAKRKKPTPAALEKAALARATKMAKRWLDKKFVERFYNAWLRSVDALTLMPIEATPVARKPAAKRKTKTKTASRRMRDAA